MNIPKIIFFDIDETLYDKANNIIRPSVFLAMKALKRKGILTAIATGRPEVAIPMQIKELIKEAEIDVLVTINGQYISYRGKMLHSYPLDRGNVDELCHYLNKNKIIYACVANDNIALSNLAPEVVAEMNKILPQHPIDKNYYQEHDIYQVFSFYDEDFDNTIQPIIDHLGFKTVRWDMNAVDILDKEGSKARGIQIAIEKLGIEIDEVMAFGDGLNDIEMLENVGFGVAMGNAHDELKKIADYICPSIDEDGVYQGLKNLGIID